MAKLRLARPKVRQIGLRLKPINLNTEVVSPHRAERKRMYSTPQWSAVRKAHLKQEPRCRICGSYKERVVDHILGHDDAQAYAAANRIGLPSGSYHPDWRSRFYTGPFLTLCKFHHDQKTGLESAGKLMTWITEILMEDRDA